MSEQQLQITIHMEMSSPNMDHFHCFLLKEDWLEWISSSSLVHGPVVRTFFPSSPKTNSTISPAMFTLSSLRFMAI